MRETTFMRETMHVETNEQSLCREARDRTAPAMRILAANDSSALAAAMQDSRKQAGRRCRHPARPRH